VTIEMVTDPGMSALTSIQNFLSVVVEMIQQQSFLLMSLNLAFGESFLSVHLPQMLEL
jgi:hypothetical protein